MMNNFYNFYSMASISDFEIMFFPLGKARAGILSQIF